MSPPIQVSEQQARTELNDYIFGGQYGRPTVPRDLDPQIVDQFIRTRVDRRAPPSAFERSRRAADWYDLQSLATHFQRLFDHSEKGERSYDQSLGVVALVATVGNIEQTRQASEYWAYLVHHPLALERFNVLVEALECFGPYGNPQPLEERLTGRLRGLQKGSDEYERVDQELNNNLPRVLDEARLEREILAAPDAAERMKRLASVYAGWDEVESLELTWWSARWLRRVSRAGESQAVTSALRSVLAEVDGAKLPAEERAPYRTRILRAIRFLGGTISDTERRFLERSAARQWDVLDHESAETVQHG